MDHEESLHPSASSPGLCLVFLLFVFVSRPRFSSRVPANARPFISYAPFSLQPYARSSSKGVSTSPTRCRRGSTGARSLDPPDSGFILLYAGACLIKRTRAATASSGRPAPLFASFLFSISFRRPRCEATIGERTVVRTGEALPNENGKAEPINAR